MDPGQTFNPLVLIADQIPQWPWVAAALVLIFLLSIVWRIVTRPRYQAQERLFTPTEKNFLFALDRAIGEQYRIFGKVRIADVLGVHSGKTTAKARWWKAFRKISSKHVDYVLIDPGTTRIIAAIELDDRSHDTRERKERDGFVNRAFSEAGLPLIRFPAARNYDPARISERLRQALAG
jgi:hypothetical protein